MKTVTSLQICISVIFVLGMMACCTRGGEVQLLGGLSVDVKQADKDIQQMVDDFKSEIEAKTNTKFKSLQALTYKTQVVAGLNYFVKVRGITEAGVEEILHLRIYRHFKNPKELTAVKQREKLDSPIVHFEA